MYTFKEGNFDVFSSHQFAAKHALHGRACLWGTEWQLCPLTAHELLGDLIPSLWSAQGSPTVSPAHYHLCKAQSSPSPPPVSRGVAGAERSAVYTPPLSLGPQTSQLFSMGHRGNRTHLIYLANYFQTRRLQKRSIKDNSFFGIPTLLASG